MVFIPPALLNERRTAGKQLISYPQWTTERALLGAAVWSGLGLSGVQEALQWTGYRAKNKHQDPRLQFCTCDTNTTKGLCPSVLSLRPLPLPALSTGHRTGHSWSMRTPCWGILQQLHCNGLVLETTEQWQAPALVLHPALPACSSVPGILQEICSLQPQEKEEQQKRSGEERRGREGEREDERLCNYSLTSCKTQAEKPDLVIAISNPKFLCSFSLLAASPSACKQLPACTQGQALPQGTHSAAAAKPHCSESKGFGQLSTQVALLQNNTVFGRTKALQGPRCINIKDAKGDPSNYEDIYNPSHTPWHNKTLQG